MISQADPTCPLADIVIAACAEAWRGDPEWLATGITPVPRLGASLAKLTFNPALMMTDGENHFVETPLPIGPREASQLTVEGWAPYARTFDNLWGGRRHAMVAPVQIDRFGQVNISIIGDYGRPKAALLGARGFPGNSISHPNSFFFPQHNRRAFVAGEVDFVCSAGYNPNRWLGGVKPPGLELRRIVTNLCVMDFAGPEHAIRLVSLHPGVALQQVQDNTGFDLHVEGSPASTPIPDEADREIIARLDPHGVRTTLMPDAQSAAASG